MRAEDLDKASIKELQQHADRCFEMAQSPRDEPLFVRVGAMPLTLSDEAKLRLLLEAQFYLTAIARKRDEEVANRDEQLSNRSYKLEKWVIVLIGIEIVLSIIGILVGISEGRDQSKVLSNIQQSTHDSAIAMSAASTSLKSIADEQTASRDALKQMNENLQKSLTLTGSMATSGRKELAIFQDQQAKGIADAARKPKLILIFGWAPLNPDSLNSGSYPNPKPREETDTSISFDVLFANNGDKTATNPLLRVTTSERDISVQSSSGSTNEAELRYMAQRVFLISFDNMRAGITIPLALTMSYPKGHGPFQLTFSCDADEIQTGTPMGSVLIKPRNH